MIEINDDKMDGESECSASGELVRGILLLQEKWVMLIVHKLMNKIAPLKKEFDVNVIVITTDANNRCILATEIFFHASGFEEMLCIFCLANSLILRRDSPI